MLGDVIGGLGVICFLSAYFLLQKETWKAQSLPYLACNLAGALLVMCSLLMDWNLPAFLLEAAWAWISIWGLCKLYSKRRTP